MGQIVTTKGKGIVLNRTFLATPTQLAPSQFEVGTGTTAPVVGDTDLETKVILSGADYFKDFVSGFPTLDTTNIQATTRMFLNSLEANGNDLTEMGVFNADGTPVLFSRSTFTSLSKTSSIEVTFIEKNSVV